MSPSIDIVVLTFNHAAYIQKCLESIANQEYAGKIRVIIVNDASTDATQIILNQLRSTFPWELIIFENDSNQGIVKNIQFVASELCSSFVAFVDGDDYWTEKFKLQKQVDFLESNREYIGCFHDVDIHHEDNLDSDLFQSKNSYNHVYQFPEAFCLTEVLYRKIIPTSSVVVRISGLEKIEWRYIADQYSTFWKVMCFIVNGSKLKYINESWSVYRNHKQGISKAMRSEDFHWSHFNFLRKILFMSKFKLFRYEILTQLLIEAELTLQRTNSKFRKISINLQFIFFTSWRLCFLNKRH